MRANGVELVRAVRDRPEVLQAIHDLKNWEIRQAAINSGIDLGTRHVGSRQGLGPEQISRQDLLDQMIRQGVKPEDIPRLAQTEPISYTKPMPIAKGLRQRMGISDILTDISVLHHELAHAIVGVLNGFEQYGIVSHRNPVVARGSLAAAMFRLGQFANPITGLFRPEKLVGRIDDLADLFAAGAAVNELIDGIPRDTNPGLVGDRNSAARLFAGLDIPTKEWPAMFDAAVDRAIAKLSKSGILDIIKDEATRREDNLPVGYHFSERRIAHIIERVRRETTPQYQLELQGQGQLFGPSAGAAEQIGRGGPEAVAGGEGPGARAAAEASRLKAFRPPRNTYEFTLRGGGPEQTVTLDALNRKQAFREVQRQYPGRIEYEMRSERRPEVGPPVQVEPVEARTSPLRNVPARLADHLLPDEIENLSKRPVLQKNFVKAYEDLAPTAKEIINTMRAGYGLGGWWQRFIDSFEALGRTTDAKAIQDLGFEHAEALKAFHSALSGNKLVSQANRIGWGAYRDWLEAGRPTDARSLSRIIRNNRGISGIGNLDTNQLYKLVNSPQFQQGAPFHGEAWMRSPVPGKGSGAKKIPSMAATVAGEGNLGRLVLDTHMGHLYGLNKLNDADYLAMSVHMRQAAEAIDLAGGEGQEQSWGTVIALKKLLKQGMTPQQAAKAFGPDVVGSIGKDYAQTILDSMEKDPEVRQAMKDLKEYGFDPGGPVASEALRRIAEEATERMAARARPGISERLLARSAQRIQETMQRRAAAKARARARGGG